MPTLLPPTFKERMTRAVSYVFIAVVGFGTFAFPVDLDPNDVLSQSTKERLGWAMWVWSAFMATALLCALGSALGRHRFEYVTLPLCGTALLVGSLNTWWNVLTSDSTLTARASSTTALVLLLAVRWGTLHRLNRVPGIWTLIGR